MILKKTSAVSITSLPVPLQAAGDHVVYVAMGTLAQLSEHQVGRSHYATRVHVLHRQYIDSTSHLPFLEALPVATNMLRQKGVHFNKACKQG
jgi:hypothetical protein